MPNEGEKQLNAVENYGMPSVERIYERFSDQFSPVQGCKSEADFKTFWDNMAGKMEGIQLQDSTGIALHFPKNVYQQTIDQGHWKIAKSAFALLRNANEIWASDQNSETELSRTYIGYYQDQPIVLLANQKGIVQTFYQWEKPHAELEKLRKGVLIKRR
jgi:hypothetical protein